MVGSNAAIASFQSVRTPAREPISEPERRTILINAAKQVGPALFFSLLIIVVSFLPVFLLEAQEGRMFRSPCLDEDARSWLVVHPGHHAGSSPDGDSDSWKTAPRARKPGLACHPSHLSSHSSLVPGPSLAHDCHQCDLSACNFPTGSKAGQPVHASAF
jgi:hypothetical protein